MKRRFLQELVRLGADTPCAADLLRYFYRHPSLYVTTDRLVSSVGYDQNDIEAALATLMQGGLILQRRHQHRRAALYHLVTQEWLSELAEVTSTARGRRHLRLVLRSLERCRRAAAATARGDERLHCSDRLLATIREIRRAG